MLELDHRLVPPLLPCPPLEPPFEPSLPPRLGPAVGLEGPDWLEDDVLGVLGVCHPDVAVDVYPDG
jgi:hypothetical protein